MFSNRISFLRMIVLSVAFVMVIALSSCNTVTSGDEENPIQPTVSYTTPEIEFGSNEKFTTVATDTSPTAPSFSVPDQTFTPGQTATPAPDTRLTPYSWREWPVNPELSQEAQGIIMNAVNNPALDPRTFSKVGDCQMTSGTFLGGFANGKYAIPEGYDETVRWFSESMMGESITAANGLGINSVLNPMFGLSAGHQQCDKNESPLGCELRTKRPAVVLIAMGTNWKPNAEVSFDEHLRVVVERILETGALPILATKADNIEGDWKLNQVIAQVAFDYDLPLVNVWRSVQDLPNHGLGTPENIYLTGDGWMRRNYAWLAVLEKVRKVMNGGPAG